MPHEVVTVDWEGRSVGAFVPAPPAELGLLGAAAQRDAARAEGMLSASAVLHDPRLEVAAPAFAHRGGGVKSDRGDQRSSGTRSSRRCGSVGSWPGRVVADDLRAVDAALAQEGPLTPEALLDWHRILVASADLDDHHKGRVARPPRSGRWPDTTPSCARRHPGRANRVPHGVPRRLWEQPGA
jgi:hypothetical protein